MGVLPNRRERRKARTLSAILDAADRHFLEGGYEEAKIDAIAADADVAVGSIYNYFGSKDGLYAALLERALDLFEAYLGEGAPLELSPLEQVLEIGGRFARFARERPGEMRLVCMPQPSGAGEPLSEALERISVSMATHERRTAALIEAAVQAGDVRPVDARATAAYLWAGWKGALIFSRAEVEAVLEAGLRVVVGGLASDSARTRDDTVRAILESAPGRSLPEPREPSPGLRAAPVASVVRERFPGLALWTAELDGSAREAPDHVRRLLAEPPAGVTGAAALGTRGESAPWAYRVFLRCLGVDPERAESVVDAFALGRAAADAPQSRGLPEDALAIAARVTGVPIMAFDAGRLEGTLWLREAHTGERIAAGEALDGLPVLADNSRAVALPFGARDPSVAVTASTDRIALAALQVVGIPDIAVEESMWTAMEILREAGEGS